MFALIGGDLGYDNGPSGRHGPRSSCATTRGRMTDSQGRLIPMVTCIGNHEVAGRLRQDTQGGDRSSSRSSMASTRKRSYATLDFGDYLSLVLLDTGTYRQDRRRANRVARQGR